MQTSAALTSSRLVTSSKRLLRAYGLLPNCLLLMRGRRALEPNRMSWTCCNAGQDDFVNSRGKV
jgi:hypothetical protein